MRDFVVNVLIEREFILKISFLQSNFYIKFLETKINSFLAEEKILT